MEKTKAQLLGFREVFDVDPTKKFMIADILTDGALLPHSVTLAELMVINLKYEDIKPTHKVIDIDTGKTICTLPIRNGGQIPTYRTAIVAIESDDDEEKSEICTCYEFICDNPNCPDHKHLYQVGEFSDSDIQDHLGIYNIGMGV